MNKVIEAKNLTKIYGKKAAAFTALKNINLSIYEGESVAIVGKSGSGKSTLMHILALLDRPTKGEILIDGKNASKLKNKELNKLRNERFGFVFQQFFMNANDTVLENVLLPLKIAKLGRKKRKKEALEALKIVDLESKVKNKATDLSGGQKQRTASCRALVSNPKLIFADEPTGALDSKSATDLLKALSSLNEDQEATIMMVTHDAFAASFCRRILFISDGRLSREMIRGTHSRKEFYQMILEKLAQLDGDGHDIV